jgi:acyltransferase
MLTRSSSAAHGRPKGSTGRWLALDVFRAIAVLSMIQGHAFTALLRPEEYAGSWSAVHTIVHGLTAPMFLLGAGLSYGIVVLRSEGKAAGANMRIVRRALMLLALGYFLQLPRATWGEILARVELYEVLTRVGPLQLVGVCLLLAEALRLCSPGRAGFRTLSALVAACLVCCAPLVWQWRLSRALDPALGMWLDGHRLSLFPLFPWAAFFFVGLLASQVIERLRSRAPHGQRVAGPLLLGVGAACALAAYGLYVHGYLLRSVYGAHELWHTNPLYVAFRAGLALAWLGILSVLEPWLAALFGAAPAVARTSGALAKQSLVAYVVHLLALYGTPLTVGLVRLGTTLSMAQALSVVVALWALTVLVALLWERYLAPVTLARKLLVLVRAQIDRVGEGERRDIPPTEQELEPVAAQRDRVKRPLARELNA